MNWMEKDGELTLMSYADVLSDWRLWPLRYMRSRQHFNPHCSLNKGYPLSQVDWKIRVWGLFHFMVHGISTPNEPRWSITWLGPECGCIVRGRGFIANAFGLTHVFMLCMGPW